jgi:hypothetical protein
MLASFIYFSKDTIDTVLAWAMEKMFKEEVQ